MAISKASTCPNSSPVNSSSGYCLDFNYTSCQSYNINSFTAVKMWCQSSSMSFPNHEALSSFLLNHTHGLSYDHSYLNTSYISSHSNKLFVSQLIDDLQHGCSIGYAGPQFTHLANNLLSVYQQAHIIDATLQERV